MIPELTPSLRRLLTLLNIAHATRENLELLAPDAPEKAAKLRAINDEIARLRVELLSELDKHL